MGINSDPALKSTTSAKLQKDKSVVDKFSQQCSLDSSAKTKEVESTERRIFVEGWEWYGTLGEGAFGDVRLLRNIETEKFIAVKIINNQQVRELNSVALIKKEIAIHSKLHHANIVSFIGSRTERDLTYIYLEYMPGGELFDKIDIERGMDREEARNYFRQLIEAVHYLQERGVTHRDIKPENLLISDTGVLKLADFGLSTVYRHNGAQRRMDKSVGTPPYVAPEVITGCKYNGGPVDIWSSGIVLVAMMTGELPWPRATIEYEHYRKWADSQVHDRLWQKFNSLELDLLRKVLCVDPDKRIKIDDLVAHKWVLGEDCLKETSWSPLNKRYRSVFYEDVCQTLFTEPQDEAQSDAQPLSQPVHSYSSTASAAEQGASAFSLSQPAKLEDVLGFEDLNDVCSQSQTCIKDKANVLVKRMTRFTCTCMKEEALDRLQKAVKHLGVDMHEELAEEMYVISGIDRHGQCLKLKCMIVPFKSTMLLTFRLSKGDGLEFKRVFSKLREQMKGIIGAENLFDNRV